MLSRNLSATCERSAIPETVTLWCCPACGFAHPLIYGAHHPVFRTSNPVGRASTPMCGVEPVETIYRREAL